MKLEELSKLANNIDDESVEGTLTTLELGEEISDKQYFILKDVISVYRGFRNLQTNNN